jgi:hypothetical protein
MATRSRNEYGEKKSAVPDLFFLSVCGVSMAIHSQGFINKRAGKNERRIGEPIRRSLTHLGAVVRRYKASPSGNH